VRQAQVLGEEVVRAEAQSRHRIELAVARGEKDDRQLRRQRAQLPAQLKAAFRLILQRDVDDRESGRRAANALIACARLA